MAAGLGVGRHIMVRTADGKEYHGNIVAIAAENLSVLPDRTGVPVQIAYNSVQQMGPNLSKASKIALIVVAGIVVAWIIYLAAEGSLSD